VLFQLAQAVSGRPPTDIIIWLTAALLVVAIVTLIVIIVRQPPESLPPPADGPLQWRDPGKLRAEGLIPPHPKYVDRGIDRAALCRHRKLAFVGPPKTGKTREAVWTALAFYDDRPSSCAIFLARPPLEVPRTVLQPDVDQPIVIVDDIARMGRAQRHDREIALPTVLDELRSLEGWLTRNYPDGCWLILTSRLDEWETLARGRRGAILGTYERVPVDAIEGKPEEAYVHRVCELVGWNPPGEALTTTFAELNDGTFLSLHDFLLVWKREHPDRIDLTEGDAEAFRWRRDRAWEDERDRLPQAQRDLLDALALLREIGAPLYGPLAVEMCCHRRAFLHRHRYRRALEALCETWLRQEPGGMVSTHDSRLQRDKPVADEEVATLARLLLRFSRRRRHRAASAPLLSAAYTGLEEACRRRPELYALRLRVAERALALTPDEPAAAVRAGVAELELGLVRDAARHIPPAIALYRRALGRWTEEDAPRYWAMTQNNLGIAWRNLPTGDRGENLQRAIACYEAALRVYTERDYPADWATTQNNLGVAWRNLPTGGRGGNLQRAIACYEAALRVHTERNYPADWARTQNNLGNAWSYLPTGDRGQNLQRAIACFEAALRVYTERNYPPQWATTQNNLGTAWSDVPTGDRGENLRRAIACYDAALRVYTERDYPAQWATTQNNLGNAWSDLPTGDRGENLQRAIGCYEAALWVYTERDYPADWAMTQNNLGNAWSDLPTGDRGENLQRAIACYEAALRVRTERDYPADWAATQFNLALLFEELPSGDAAQDLARALSHAENARRGFQAAGMPRDVDKAKRLIARLKAKLDDCSEQAESLPA